MTNKQEQGRSMVEMLGVLAVVGVLSAGGIAGYTYAMDRHRTNEVLNEASKRAVVVASQIALGRPVSLAEFGMGETAGGKFATDAVTDIDGAVGIKVTGVKDSVCKNLVKLENDVMYVAKDDDSLTALTEADCTGDNATFLIVFEGMGGGTAASGSSNCWVTDTCGATDVTEGIDVFCNGSIHYIDSHYCDCFASTGSHETCESTIDENELVYKNCRKTGSSADCCACAVGDGWDNCVGYGVCP